jgi:alpha-tubulin suppressor-like RCC1 family protein
VGADANWVAVSASDSSLAIKADGSLWAWGQNNYGQLGNGTSGTTANRNTPVQIGTGYRVPTK